MAGRPWKGDYEGAARREGDRPNPTDGSKLGTKRSILVDGNGIPLAVAVAGVNRHDMKLVGPASKNIVIDRPKPTKKHPHNICIDKAYDFPSVDQLVAEWGYTTHIARRGVDWSKRKRLQGYRARRWVVERTNSWMNRFRRFLIRWEKKKKTTWRCYASRVRG